MLNDRPIYLHFLDRELGNSVDTELPDAHITKVIKLLLLGTTSPMYCGLSLVWEHPEIGGELTPLLELAIQTGILDLVSHHNTVDEFMDSRHRLYAHDQLRYPSYFSSSSRENFRPSVYKPSGTTESLEGSLYSHLGIRPDSRKSSDLSIDEGALSIVESVLSHREGAAITYALFEPTLSRESDSSTSWGLKRAISRLYCNEYLGFNDGVIPTGIPAFGFFDSVFSDGFPRYDVRVLEGVFSFLGFNRVLSAPGAFDGAYWSELVERRNQGNSPGFALGRLLRLAAGVEIRTTDTQSSARSRVTNRVLSWLGRELNTTKGTARNTEDLNFAIQIMEGALQRLRKDRNFGSWIELLEYEESPTADWLIVTVTGTESDALDAEFARRYNTKPQIEIVNGETLRTFGQVAGESIWNVRTQMGSLGPGGSAISVLLAIDAIHPKCVVAPGIAFGFNPRAQPIGQVLVSETILNYNILRASTGVGGSLKCEPRSTRPAADANLVSRYKALSSSAHYGLKAGLVVSGEALVDNLQYREEILRLAPGAIGGEMEGYGTYSASERRHIPWIVVKAVCDWADGGKSRNKNSRQLKAAEASMSLLCDCIELGGL